MDFNLTDEQRMLQDTVARLIREQYDFESRMKLLETPEGYSKDIWAQFADLGLLGIPFSEESGGFGGGGIELMLVMQEFGRGLVVEPYLATVVLAGSLVEALGSDAQKEAVLEPVIGGERIMAFAHGEPESRYELSAVRTRAEKTGAGYKLTGHKAVVLHGDAADQLVVSARVGGKDSDTNGIGLFLVDADAKGVSRRGYQTADGLRAAELRLDGVEVGADAVLGEPGKAYAAIEQVVGRAIAALCAEAVGAMEASCNLTLEYLNQRKQFGVPIGKFQALQHRMVDMSIELEQARSMAILAASRLHEERKLREQTLSAAKARIGKAGRFIAEQSIQLHGGIGMTWEYAGAHYAKRLVMIDHVLGDTDYHVERFVALTDGQTEGGAAGTPLAANA